MTDTVADMITRIKNAYMAKHETVRLPATKMRESIANILVESGYLANSTREEKSPQDELVLTLRYVHGKPSMTDVDRVSKPGRRIYRSADKVPNTLNGYGTTVISTSQGIKTDKAARQAGIGGEVLFQIW